MSAHHRPAPGDWRQRAACGPDTAHLFHSPAGREPPKVRQARVHAALALCARCPVQIPCRIFAQASRDGFAILGATTPEQRGYSPATGHRLAAARPRSGKGAA